MHMFRLISALSKSKLLSISTIGSLSSAIRQHGVNLMALLQFAASKYGRKLAFIDDERELTFHELLEESMQLAGHLKHKYELKPKMKVGIYCRNHHRLVKALFALSRLGLDIYLINTEMGNVQLEQLVKKHRFDLLLYDAQFSHAVQGMKAYTRPICLSDVQISAVAPSSIEKTASSKIILLTSGTTGAPKEVAHQPSLFNYLPPFIGMVDRLKLVQYNNGYIATPVYHGYGLAILFLFVVLGKTVIVSERFEAKRACAIIEKHQVEIVTVVPLMIHKMLQENVACLRSLRCIASGGAVLNASLVRQVQGSLGNVLYNLYGTSETGLNVIATPEDLAYSPHTIGRCIEGMQMKVEHSSQKVIGPMYVKSKSGMVNSQDRWVSTGDLGYQDEQGYYFLAGRQDDLVISGGENVHPLHVEHILLEHPYVEDAAVIGVADEQFGQRLHAFVQLKDGHGVERELLLAWLKSRVARYEMPRDISFLEQIPYTALGKKDKKALNKCENEPLFME